MSAREVLKAIGSAMKGVGTVLMYGGIAILCLPKSRPRHSETAPATERIVRQQSSQPLLSSTSQTREDSV